MNQNNPVEADLWPYTRECLGVTFCVLAALQFLLQANDWGTKYFPDLQFGNRFQTDNAAGAAANALEHLAKHPTQEHLVRPADWLLAGLLCFCYARLGRLMRVLAPRNPLPPPVEVRPPPGP